MSNAEKVTFTFNAALDAYVVTLKKNGQDFALIRAKQNGSDDWARWRVFFKFHSDTGRAALSLEHAQAMCVAFAENKGWI